MRSVVRTCLQAHIWRNARAAFPKSHNAQRDSFRSFTCITKPGELCCTRAFQCGAVTRRESGRRALRDKESRAKLRGEGRERPQSSPHSMDRLAVFIEPTRHRVRRSLPQKCCSQMDRLSQNYLLPSSFLVDYATVSQHRLNSLALSLLPACLAQGESDVGQGEDSVLSLTSSEIQSRYQELT